MEDASDSSDGRVDWDSLQRELAELCDNAHAADAADAASAVSDGPYTAFTVDQSEASGRPLRPWQAYLRSRRHSQRRIRVQQREAPPWQEYERKIFKLSRQR